MPNSRTDCAAVIRDCLRGWSGFALLALAGCAVHPPDEAPDYSVLGEWFIGCEIKTATVHTCTDYYGTFPAGFDAKSALSNQCTAAMGAVLKNKCDTAPAVGSCTVASQPSGGTQNAVTWTYADSNTMTTADQANAACMGTFAVHGSYTLTTM